MKYTRQIHQGIFTAMDMQSARQAASSKTTLERSLLENGLSKTAFQGKDGQQVPE
jgi:hypothetical protein